MKLRCHNRPAYAPGRWHATGRKVQNGTREHQGAPVVWGPVKPVLRFYPRWFEDRCATWSGVGIGRPTEKYPNGVPYPMAHGYDCRGCRWLPDEHKEDVCV